MEKSHDDIGNLDAGIVDVVLNLDLVSREAENANESIADGGVPKVTDVGRLVRIDVGVLDDHLPAGGFERRQPAGPQRGRRRSQDESPVEVEVDEAGTRDFHFVDAVDFERACQFAGNCPRGFSERLGQSKAERRCQLAKLDLGCPVEYHLGQVELPESLRGGLNGLGDTGLHGRLHNRQS